MKNKRNIEKASRRDTRTARNAEKVQRNSARKDGDLGKLVDTIQKQKEREEITQVAARIVTETSK
jgi:hypothetical protein